VRENYFDLRLQCNLFNADACTPIFAAWEAQRRTSRQAAALLARRLRSQSLVDAKGKLAIPG